MTPADDVGTAQENNMKRSLTTAVVAATAYAAELGGPEVEVCLKTTGGKLRGVALDVTATFFDGITPQSEVEAVYTTAQRLFESAESVGVVVVDKDGAEFLQRTEERLTTQDNQATAHPVYQVRQWRRSTCPLDPRYVDDMPGNRIVDVYIDRTDGDEYGSITEAEKYGACLDDVERVTYERSRVVVQLFFTRAAADAYIAANGHNLDEPDVYIDSAWRNDEWQAIRALLGAKGDS